MSPDQAAREWLESSEYVRLATQALSGADLTPIIHPITLERHVQKSMSVESMRNFVASIYAAGYRDGSGAVRPA
jgi:hypothetical protein